MDRHTKQFKLRTAAIILVVAALLIGGISFTKAAAQGAIPGDALYPVKTTIEQTRLTLAQDAGNRAEMRMAFAEQRLNEIKSLIKDGRYREVRSAILAFEAEINRAILELETVSGIDPERASQIALKITAALSRYAQALIILAADAPESVRPEVMRALDTTQIVSGLQSPSGSVSTDNSNANSNGDDGNANSNDDNSNANSNGDDGSNANSNDDNSNANSNGDDGNTNSNDDDSNANDDDSNANDDDSNANDDDDGNGNSNDDDGNANDDDDGNGNSNDDDGNANDDDGGNGNSNDDDGNANDDDGGNGNSNDDDGNANDDDGGKGKDDNSNGDD